MIQIRKIAITLMTLAAVAVPASTVTASTGDDRDSKKRVDISYGVNLNLGNLSIQARNTQNRGYKNSRPTRVYLELTRDHHHNDYYLTRFESSVRSGFERSARGNFDIVRSPRYADIVIRLNRHDWGNAYNRYVSAGRHGCHNERYDTRASMIDKVAHRVLERAYDERKRYSHHARHDRDDDRRYSRYDGHRYNRYDSYRGYDYYGSNTRYRYRH